MIKALLLSFIILSCSKAKKETSHDLTTPSLRNAHAMVYHDSEQAIYLFSGASESEVKSDLWRYKSSKWTQIKTQDTPKERTFASFVYDPLNESLLLFGGNSVLFGYESNPVQLLNDTWEFKNNIWLEIKSHRKPKARAESALSYDELNQRFILFGGYEIVDENYIKLNDTWEFKNKEWSLIAENGPSARHGVSMFYDKRTQKITLFGGSTVDKQYGEEAGETWQLTNNTWTKIRTVFIEGIYNAALAYDDKNNFPILFGGWDGNKRLNKSLKFQNNAWIRLRTQVQPEARNHSQMIYDKSLEKMILYGGHDGENVFADMWEFNSGTWKLISDEKSKKRINNGH